MLPTIRQSQLNAFIDLKSPKQGDNSATSQAIDAVVREIQRIKFQSFSVDRVYKGGSRKKGTALREDSDVDLVVFLKGPFDQFSQNYLAQLTSQLKRTLNCSIIRENKFVTSLKHHSGVDFDILVAYDATKNNRNQVAEQRKRARELIKDLPNKLYYSTCFTESSCEFIHSRSHESPEKLARAIKLAKLWNKHVFSRDPSHKTVLRSYAVELLLSKIYDDTKAAGISGPDMFVQMLDMLIEVKNKHNVIQFDDFFPITAFPNPDNRPLRIYDPCFPEADVVGDFEAWTKLSKQARKTRALLYSDCKIEDIFKR